jgi:long-chain acyl-CoA synthetase
LIGHLALALVTPCPLVLLYRFDPAVFLDAVAKYRATFTVGAITAFIALMNDPRSRGANLSSLRAVYSGGQPIPAATVAAFEAQFGVEIRPSYGLTEATAPTHLVPLGRKPPVDPETGSLSVGLPVFETAVAILDGDGRRLPPYSVGEIAVSGPQVVPGYWSRDEETANMFTADGFLRTGDAGYVTDEGWLFIVDRMKDLIIASGYKVWPREVEDVLYEHPAIREAAVVGRPDPYRGETVVAFASLRPGASATAEELVDFCRARLAAYKYPRAVHLLDDLPKTASGKILRRELRHQTA